MPKETRDHVEIITGLPITAFIASVPKIPPTATWNDGQRRVIGPMPAAPWDELNPDLWPGAH